MLEPRSAGYGGVSVGRAGDGFALWICKNYRESYGIFTSKRHFVQSRSASPRTEFRHEQDLPLARRSGYTMGRSIESEKVKLGWTPKVTFNQLVKIMVDAKLQAVEKG